MRTALLLALLASCGSTTEPGRSAARYRVLFLGNSLTYTNDLPSMVEAIGLAAGDTFTTKMLAYPNWGLQDHWETGTVRAEIASGEWDFVVMQQGPSSLASSRVDLLTWAARLSDLAHQHDVCPAFYMVWPAKAYIGSFDAVRAHYREAADSNRGLLLPAGEAWRNGWPKDPGLALYGPDDFHPSPLGTYLAALTIYAGVTGKSPVGNSAAVPGSAIDARTRRLLQESAAEAVRGVDRRCAVN